MLPACKSTPAAHAMACVVVAAAKSIASRDVTEVALQLTRLLSAFWVTAVCCRRGPAVRVAHVQTEN